MIEATTVIRAARVVTPEGERPAIGVERDWDKTFAGYLTGEGVPSAHPEIPRSESS